ncbi:unnamed protein product [Moneuplotes crassus]|uniref:Uncharacterized protein n=1 Tax=Euplotes crassus TaxID=5936 RepID=A0AAD1Y2U6_EUPCR|nr:unnamed protein product [Moneuplotes crassus]
MIRYPLEKRSVANTFFHYLNLVVVLLDIGFFIYFVIQGSLTQEALTILGPIHLLLLGPSVLYHAFPAVRGNFLFNWIAHVISSLVLGLFVITIVVFLSTDPGYGKLGIFIAILFVTLPGALISLSLLFLLNSDQKKPQMSYFIGQDGKLYQAFMYV